MTKEQYLIVAIWFGLLFFLLLVYVWSNYERRVFYRRVLQEMKLYRNKEPDYLLFHDETDKIPITV